MINFIDDGVCASSKILELITGERDEELSYNSYVVYNSYVI